MIEAYQTQCYACDKRKVKCHGSIMNKPVRHLKNTDVIKQTNIVNNATYSLTLNEKRIVYLMLNEIAHDRCEVDENGIYPIVINHQLYKNIFRYDGARNVSRDIRAAAEGLNKKEIIFYLPEEDSDDEKALDALAWTVMRSHRPRQNMTTLYLNPLLVNILKKTDSKYSALIARDIAMLTKPSSMRLYDVMKQWENQGTVTRTIEYLVKRFSLPEKYITRLSDFRRRFLHPAIEEINEKSSISVDAIEVKSEGTKKTHAIKFMIKSKQELFTQPDYTLEHAKVVYTDIMSRTSIPSINEIEVLKKFMPELIEAQFEFDSVFYDNLSEVELRAKELEEF